MYQLSNSVSASLALPDPDLYITGSREPVPMTHPRQQASAINDALQDQRAILESADSSRDGEHAYHPSSFLPPHSSSLLIPPPSSLLPLPSSLLLSPSSLIPPPSSFLCPPFSQGFFIFSFLDRLFWQVIIKSMTHTNELRVVHIKYPKSYPWSRSKHESFYTNIRNHVVPTHSDSTPDCPAPFATIPALVLLFLSPFLMDKILEEFVCSYCILLHIFFKFGLRTGRNEKSVCHGFYYVEIGKIGHW